MSSYDNFEPEIFLKDKLEELLNVCIRQNTNGNDPPDLEFEWNGKQIGIEVMRITKKMDDGTDHLWLKDNLAKTIKPCLETFEKKYARDIRNKGEKRRFFINVTYQDFKDRMDTSREIFNAIKDDIPKIVTQGLKVIFKLPEVRRERFFSQGEKLDFSIVKNTLGETTYELWQLNRFWAGNCCRVRIDKGSIEKTDFGYSIKIDEGFDLGIYCWPFQETVPVSNEKLFDKNPLWNISEGAELVDKELALLKKHIQAAIYQKKKKCMKKLGQRKGNNDKYDEIWLYLYDDISAFLSQLLKRKQTKDMLFNFENYWSKVCIFTTIITPKWYLSLNGDHRYVAES